MGNPDGAVQVRAAALTPRRRLELAIEAGIALLDSMEGDHDLEDGGDDEPSLCGIGMPVSGGSAVYLRGVAGAQYDLEEGAELL